MPEILRMGIIRILRQFFCRRGLPTIFRFLDALEIQVAGQVSPRDGEDERYQQLIRLSDKNKRWFLCTNGSEIAIKEVRPQAHEDQGVL